MNTSKPIALILGVALPLVASAAYRELPAVEGGTISGTVKLARAAPKREARKVPKDYAACGASQPDESFVVGAAGGFANVVVFLDGITEGKKIESASVEVNQLGCRYTPHVVAFTRGSTVVLKNSDPILHNTHTYSGTSTVFNLALPVQGMKVLKRIDKLGAVKFGCDAGHTWMSAWAYVTEHPYVTVTGRDGKFTLTDVPPGTYTVKAWHEVEGEKTGTVVVTRGGAATVDLAY